MAYEIDFLDICGVVIINALSLEIELSSLLWIELEAYDTEAFSMD